MSDKKLDLIAQMLAKAESTTPEEAESLTEAAEKLMLKYGIEQAMIDAKRNGTKVSTEEIIMDTIEFRGAFRLEHLQLAHQVARGLGNLRSMESRYGNKSATVYLVGHTSDVERAKQLITSLQVQCTVAVRAWWRVSKADYVGYGSYDQEVARRSFASGFAVGAGGRIANSRQEAVAESGTGAELVLANRQGRVDAFYDSIGKSKSRARGGKTSLDAHAQGRVAGANASTGEKHLH